MNTETRQYNQKGSQRRFVDVEGALRRTKTELRKQQTYVKLLRREIEKLKSENFKKIPKDNGSMTAKVRGIINEKFGIDMNMRTRDAGVVRGRMMYYHWVRRNTVLGFREIAELLATCAHHSSIIHSINQHEKYYAIEKDYREDYDDICFKIKSLETSEIEIVINPS